MFFSLAVFGCRRYLLSVSPRRSAAEFHACEHVMLAVQTATNTKTTVSPTIATKLVMEREDAQLTGKRGHVGLRVSVRAVVNTTRAPQKQQSSRLVNQAECSSDVLCSRARQLLVNTSNEQEIQLDRRPHSIIHSVRHSSIHSTVHLPSKIVFERVLCLRATHPRTRANAHSSADSISRALGRLFPRKKFVFTVSSKRRSRSSTFVKIFTALSLSSGIRLYSAVVCIIVQCCTNCCCEVAVSGTFPRNFMPCREFCTRV